MKSGQNTGLIVAIVLAALLVLSCCAAALVGGALAAALWALPLSREVGRAPRVEESVRVPQRGALILEVAPGSPAARARLRAGDIILAVDGERFEAEQTLQDLIARYEPGEEVTLTYWRRGRERQVRVTLETRPARRDSAWLGVDYRMVDDALRDD